MSDETRTLKREYREAHGAMWFGWSVAKLFNFDDRLLRELRAVFMWQQKDDDGYWRWMVQCRYTNPEQSFTRWGDLGQCLAEASQWLECIVAMEDDV